MDITRNNYAAFFLDHFEGRLSPGEREALQRFLENNPDLQAEFEAFEAITLPLQDDVRFPGKDALKKPLEESPARPATEVRSSDVPGLDGMFVTDFRTGNPRVSPAHYEAAFAAYAEGDLTPEQQQAVEAFAGSDPHYSRELQLMKKVRLASDDTIVFPGRDQLKRRRIVPIWQVVEYVAIAATIALLVVVAFTFFPLHEQVEVAYEMPGDRSGDRPEAVTDDPPLYAGVPAEMPARDAGRIGPDATATDVPPLRTSAPGMHGRHSLHLALTREDVPRFAEARADAADAAGYRATASMMEPRRTDGLPLAHRVLPERMEEKKEYLWLAYRDRSEVLALFAGDDGGVAAVESGRSVGSMLEESARKRLRQIEETLETEGSAFREMASRSVTGLSELLTSPLTTESRDPSTGRQPIFSIGNFIEVSRSGGE